MTTQMDGHTTHEEHPHDHGVGLPSGQGHDENEHPAEKMSMMKKVKAKAKKIKDSITGHVGHGHDHQEDEDDEDEMDSDTEIHDAHVTQGVTPVTPPGAQEGATGHVKSVHEAVTGSAPSGHQTSNPTKTHYVPNEEETLGWSRTDSGRSRGPEEQPFAPKNTPVTSHPAGTHSTGDLGVEHSGKLGGILEKDPQAPRDVGEHAHPANYQAKVADPTGRGYETAAAEGLLPGHGGTTRQHGNVLAGSAAAQSHLPGQGGTARHHTNILGESDPMEGMTHDPVSKPAEYQTFDTSSARYVPGQEETLGWSRTDSGRSGEPEERRHVPGIAPVTAHLGGPHSTGVHEMGQKDEPGNLQGILKRAEDLEKDPHAPSERRHAEHYQSEVSDPTGKGSKEIGVAPILHHLDRMHIHDESSLNQNLKPHSEQQESLFKPSIGHDEKLSTGSHDQFSPERVTPATSTFLDTPEPHAHPEEQQETYTGKIAAAASMVADKAKQATNTVTSKLGYGSSGEGLTTPTTGSLDRSTVPEFLDKQPVKGPLDSQATPGGYGESLKSVGTAIAGTAVGTKNAEATKLGYGGTHEGQHVQSEQPSSKLEVTGAETAAQSTMRDSGTNEVDSTPTPDKGVPVKEYLVEKLKPSEDDKALSEVITEALPLHKGKENISTTGETDGGNKMEINEGMTESGEGRKIEIKGQVTESEEVASRLGRSEETSYDDTGSGLASPGKGVVERIKDAATTWFYKGGATDDPTPTESSDPTEKVKEISQSGRGAGEPGVQ